MAAAVPNNQLKIRRKIGKTIVQNRSELGKVRSEWAKNDRIQQQNRPIRNLCEISLSPEAAALR